MSKKEVFAHIRDNWQDYQKRPGCLKAARTYYNAHGKAPIVTHWEEPFDSELEDFFQTMDSAGVKKIAYMSESTGAMQFIVYALSNNWHIAGVLERLKPGLFDHNNYSCIKGLILVKGTKSLKTTTITTREW